MLVEQIKTTPFIHMQLFVFILIGVNQTDSWVPPAADDKDPETHCSIVTCVMTLNRRWLCVLQTQVVSVMGLLPVSTKPRVM